MSIDRKISKLALAAAAAAFVMSAATGASAQQKGNFDANGQGSMSWRVDGNGRIIPVGATASPASAQAKATKKRAR